MVKTATQRAAQQCSSCGCEGGEGGGLDQLCQRLTAAKAIAMFHDLYCYGSKSTLSTSTAAIHISCGKRCTSSIYYRLRR